MINQKLTLKSIEKLTPKVTVCMYVSAYINKLENKIFYFQTKLGKTCKNA